MYFLFLLPQYHVLKELYYYLGGMASHLDVAVYQNEKKLNLFAACTWEQFP